MPFYSMWLLLLASSISPCIAANSLQVDTSISSEGYFVLSWSLDDASQTASLQQSNSPDFASPITRIVGAEGDLTITGLPDGEYYFRLSRTGNPLTEPLRVNVQHHNLQRAGLFFALGFALFVILVFSILSGASKDYVAHD